MDKEAIDAVCACYLHAPHELTIVIEPQSAHRLNLCRAWNIQPGQRILDIGCGQGDATVALAYLVGPTGHVTGIDPAPPGYGAPQTLGQAWAYTLGSALGERISFRQAEAPAFLATEEGREEFDVATLSHSLWYFQSREKVEELFVALAASRVKQVCIAEFTGQARTDAQVPHRLAVLVQRRIHRLSKPHQNAVDALNMREALDPAELLDIAARAGWRVRDRGVVEAAPGLLDGHWEVQAVTGPRFANRVREAELSPEDEGQLLGAVAEIGEFVERLEVPGELRERGAKVIAMDVTWAVLERQHHT